MSYKATCPITGEVWELDENLDPGLSGQGIRYGKKYKVEDGKVFVEFRIWVEAKKEAQ